MATKRITVSVPAEVATRIKRAAGRRHSVSEWVTNAVTRTLEEEDVTRRFLEFCDGVNASSSDEKRAEESFGRITQRTKRGRGKTAA
jgi:Arc/MetJ-type ribon-helix-helix transcriptional regulator